MPISLRLKVEFFEKSVSRVARSHKLITKTESFRSYYKTHSVSAEISASNLAVSGSAKASYEGVTSSSESFSGYKHEERTEEISYKPGFLQIERVLTTEVTINR